jgi:putative transposase
MLTEEQFETWVHHLQLPKETVEFVRRIRESEPVRRVKGRFGNVAGRYPSSKMQRTIQFESQHVELWAIYGMERDQQVLEYYDQPVRIPLSYRAATGRRTTQWHTPDFFVLTTDSAGFEEWKPERVLDRLIESQPHRYVRDATGAIRCPPGEAYAQALGLTYHVRSSGEYHPLYIQNLKFLQDFWAHPVQLSEHERDRVLAALSGEHAVTVTDLLKRYPDLSVDVIWALLSQGTIFTNLDATSLMQHDQILVSLHETQAKASPSSAPRSDLAHVLPSPYLFDGRLFQAELTEREVLLRPEVGLPLVLSLAEFQHLLATSAVTPH